MNRLRPTMRSRHGSTPDHLGASAAAAPMPTSSRPVTPVPTVPVPTVPVPTVPAPTVQPTLMTPDDIVIAVMGVSGVGKSVFISVLLGDTFVVDHGFQSRTMNLQAYSFMLQGRKIFLVDTPGFDDTTRSTTEVLTKVAHFLSTSYEAKIRLCGIIYLHRITDTRLTGAAFKSLEIFKKLCGLEYCKNVVLATTMWEHLSAEQIEVGTAHERQLLANPKFWGIMQARGSRIERYDGRYESAMDIIFYLINLRSRPPLVIQREIVDEKKTVGDTAAGMEVERELQQVKKTYKKDIEDLEESHKAALANKDAQLAEAISEQQKILKRDLRKANEDLEKLKADLKQMKEDHQKKSERVRAELVAQKEANDKAIEVYNEQISQYQANYENNEEKLRQLEQAHAKAQQGSRSALARLEGMFTEVLTTPGIELALNIIEFIPSGRAMSEAKDADTRQARKETTSAEAQASARSRVRKNESDVQSDAVYGEYERSHEDAEVHRKTRRARKGSASTETWAPLSALSRARKDESDIASDEDHGEYERKFEAGEAYGGYEWDPLVIKMELGAAIRTGDLNKLQEHLNVVPNETRNPAVALASLVLYAAREGTPAILEHLLNAEGQVKHVSTILDENLLQRALHVAVKKPHEKNMEMLLQHGAQINAPRRNGHTALHTAAVSGDENIVQKLLTLGADVNASAPNDVTPMILAAENGHLDIMATLFDAGGVLAAEHKKDIPQYHMWTMDWLEARQYLEAEFGLAEDINDILVLYGDPDTNIVCTTLQKCLSISDETEGLIDGILKSLIALIRQPTGAQPTPTHTDTPTDHLRFVLQNELTVEHGKQQLRVDALVETASTINMVEGVLVSLCSILRPAEGEISWSEAKCDAIGDHRSAITLKPLKPIQDKGCWAALFKQKTVARTASEQQRTEARLPLHVGETTFGMLRAPLSWLQELAGADTPIWLSNDAETSGGLCISGPYSLLIPKQQSLATSGKIILVWHLLTLEKVPNQGPRSRLQLLRQFRDWTKDNKWAYIERYEDFEKVDLHLLGWTKHARVTLGDRDQNYVLHRTDAKMVSKEVLETTVNLGVSVGYGGSGATVGKSFKIGNGERSSHMDKERELCELLDKSQKQQALIWNPTALQAWIVPEISIVLHMTIAYLRDQALRHTGTGDLIPNLQPLYEPNMAFTVILANFDQPTPLGAGLCLKHVVKSMLYMLGQMYISNIPTRMSRKFRGFEAHDLLYQPKHYRLMIDNASPRWLSLGHKAGWHKILPEMSAILFSADLLDVIKANEGHETDTGFDSLPESEYLLAMTASSLLELLSKYDGSNDSGGQISDNAYWHCEYLFGHCSRDCLRRDHAVCDRLSAVYDENDATVPVHRLHRYPNGAVVFRPNTGIVERVHGKIYAKDN